MRNLINRIMKLHSKIGNAVVEFIAYLFVLLFIYAAVSKLLDFENFRVQLGQSPMLGAYAEFIIWAVPLLEILVAVALSIGRYRRTALLASYTLMVMFTVYIYTILNYSSFVPCSCGGVLEKMSWNEHLIFNIVFIVLALLGVFITSQNKQSARKTVIEVVLFTVVGILSVIVLFLASEEKIHFNNGFTRRVPHSPVKMLKGISLEHNSFYIAGYDHGRIYLGNTTAPKYILEADTSLTYKNAYRLEQNNHDFKFSTAQVRVRDGYYYFADGTLPVIYRGSTKDWKGKPIYKGTTKFTTYEVIDTATFTVRALHPKTGENYLALIDIHSKKPAQKGNDILEKHIDGVFDTDGLLSYNPKLKATLYTYYYRNQYLLTKPTLDSITRGTTIDTLQQADLKFAYLHEGREKKFATQPEKINSYATTSGNYLYIKSKRLGKYDRPEMLQQASIIDVYQLDNNSYQFSFYLYHHKGEEIKSFKVYDDIIVGITKSYLVTGRFRKERFNPLK
jgi:uncharacterized membrane protein YphA (DoxX/SURF4 family)